MHFLINLMYYFEKYNADQFLLKGNVDSGSWRKSCSQLPDINNTVVTCFKLYVQDIRYTSFKELTGNFSRFFFLLYLNQFQICEVIIWSDWAEEYQ